MKHHLLSSLLALMLGGMAFSSSAVEPTLNYKEDFTTLYKGASSGNMSRSSYGYPAHYWIREGVTTKNMTANTTYDSNAAATTKRCIGWSVANQGSASNSSEALVPPKVGGTVKFWVHRSISSTTSTLASEVEIYTMTVDNAGGWTRKSLGTSDGTFDGITLAGINDAKAIVGNDLNTWKQVTITNIPDQTYLGIRLNGLLIDDFEATKAWEEWPDYVWDGTIIPYIDVTELGSSYTKYYLNEDNSLIKDNGQPYQLPVQLKMSVNAGKPTEDLFKYRFQLNFAGQDPLRITDAQGNDVILTFDNRPTSDWLTTSSAVNSHEEKDLAFAIRNMDPKYFNTNASLQAVKVDANGQDVGNPISMQRKNTVASDGTWNATSWSNFQFEALIPQPFIAYSTGTVTESTTANSLKSSTLSNDHAWFINPIGNEAPIYMGNAAGRATMQINNVVFSDPNFGLKDNITFPIIVEADRVVAMKPSVKTTTPGIYSGTMSVFVEGVDEPFVAKLEGSVKPEFDTKYLFHKENGSANATMPQGWLATDNWAIYTFTSTQAMQKVDGAWTQAASIVGTPSTDCLLSSPKINFNENAEVWFDATGYQNTAAMEVLYSTDRSNWTVLRKITAAPNIPTEQNPLTDDMFNWFMSSKSTYGENLFKTFKVTVPQAGEGYIAFRSRSSNTRVDNVVIDGTPVEVDFDVAYISQAIPSKFAVNKPKEVKVTFRNLISTINAGEYDVQIVADGIVARSFAGNKDLTAGTDVVLSTNYAFASDGEHTLAFNLVKGQNVVSTETASVNVVNEGYDEQFQVGPSHTANMLSDDWNGWPLTPQSIYAVTSEAIYPAALLQDLNPNGSSAANNGLNFDPNGTMTGLKAGDKITSIGWIAYASATVPGITSAELPVELYLENTTEATYASNSVMFKGDSEMTNVYKGKVIFDLTKTNSQRNSSTAAPGTLVDMEEPLFKIILDEPFEYTGDNLRVQLRIPKVYFNENNPVEDAEYFGWTSNNSSIGGQLMALDSKGINTNDNRILYSSGVSSRAVSAQLPMLLMTKETPANLLTGTVTNFNTKEGVEGVTVTATSPEGVTFSTTSGEGGAYEMEVGNPAFDFTVSVNAEGYRPYASKETVNLAEGDMQHDIALREDVPAHLTFDDVDFEISSNSNEIYTQDVSVSIYNAEEDFTYQGFQFDIQLPANVKLVSVASSLTNNIDLNLSNESSNTYTVLAYLGEASTEVENIATLTLSTTYNAGTSYPVENSPATISRVIFSTATGDDIMTVEGFAGKVNIELNEVVATEIKIDNVELLEPSFTSETGNVTEITTGESVSMEVTLGPDDTTDTVEDIVWSVSPENENFKFDMDAEGLLTVTTEGVVVDKETTFTITGTITHEGKDPVTGTHELTVKPLVLGDSNASGIVNVADVVTTANVANEKYDVTRFDFPNANVILTEEGGKQVINAQDVTATVNIVMDDFNYETGRGAKRHVSVYQTNDRLVADNFAVTPGKEMTIAVRLDNSYDYAALQATVIIPEGMKVAAVTKGARAANHEMACNIQDGYVKLMLFSFTNASFIDSDDALFNLVVTADENCDNLTFEGINASDAASNGYYLGFDGGMNETGTTGINGIDADKDARYYDVNGVEVKNPDKGIYIKVVNGQAVKVVR